MRTLTYLILSLLFCVKTSNAQSDIKGEIWNIHGPNKGAWDLVEDTAKGSAQPNADKDLIDMTKWDDVSGFVFNGSFRSGNGTLFQKTTLDYSSASLLDITTAFNSQLANDTVLTPARNNVYIAKIRNTESYMLIRIDEIVETTADNKDYLKFTYRKEFPITGVSSKKKEAVKIFPNPFTSSINVASNEFKKVRVMDLSGKVVYQSEFISSEITLDFLDSGIYLIELSDDSQKVVQRIVKR